MARQVYDVDRNCLGLYEPKFEKECLSCQKTYRSVSAAICTNCYINIRGTEKKLKSRIEETEKKLKSQIEETEKKLEIQMAQNEDLSSTVSFFRSSLSDPPPFSDVVLIAADDSSGQTIPANRNVLARRSPVFRAMLENEMDESISGTIKIGQVSYDTLKVFVSFLYTAEAVLHEKLACDLLVLGEKYEVPHLKGYCEKFLKSILTWENSLPIYAFARQNNSESLISESLSLILRNMPNLSQRQDYAQLVATDPRMVVQIYEAYKFQ